MNYPCNRVEKGMQPPNCESKEISSESLYTKICIHIKIETWHTYKIPGKTKMGDLKRAILPLSRSCCLCCKPPVSDDP